MPSIRRLAIPNTMLLSHDLDGDPPEGTSSFPSAIGMLHHLANHSRPDIPYNNKTIADYDSEDSFVRIGTKFQRAEVVLMWRDRHMRADFLLTLGTKARIR